MVPIGEGDDSRVVIHVVQMLLRVLGIIEHQSSSETITVLGREMAVIPVGPRLSWGLELVQK